MNTKLKLLPLLLLGLTGSVRAADAHAVIIEEDDAEPVYIQAASGTGIQYKTKPESLDIKRIARAKLVAVFFYEPVLFKEGMRLYRNRAYKEAQGKFTECREAFKAVDDLPGNYSTLAGFYEIECSRKIEDLEGMVQLMDDFRPGSLVREEHKNQLEIFTVWGGVRTKSWRKILMDTPDMLAQNKWTGTQLAQIYYCRGLALEGMNEPIQALTSFNGTITADYTASEKLTQKATLNCLRIITGLEEVQLAMKLFGTEDENKNTTGYSLLQEAVALCELWEKALGGGTALPPEFKSLLNFKEKVE